MKNILFGIAAMLLVFTVSAQTKTIPLSGEQTGLSVKTTVGQNFTAAFSISEFALTRVNTSKGYFTMLDVPAFTKRYDDGRPAVPLFSQMIEIPAGATASIKIISYNIEEYDLNYLGFTDKIVPAQPSWSKSTDPSNMIFYYDNDYYQLNQFSQNELIQVVPSGIMRGISFGNIMIDPISYNPVTNKIEVYTNISFEVTFRNTSKSASYQTEKERLYSPLYSGFYKEIPNFSAPSTKDVITEYPIKYVIVADRMFETALQPFIQWKTEKGFTVIEAYTDMPAVGTSTTTIKAYLQGLYDAGTVSDPAPTYILFVGDVAQIPNYSSQSSGTHVTDLYYACYDGASDNIPDVYYGRFSAQNVSQLTPQIDKTLMYEKYTMPNPNYLDTVVMIAGVDDGSQPDGGYSQVWANGQINYGTTNYFNAAHGIYSYTYLWPVSNNSSTDVAIRTNIGKGVGYANYTAHCSSSGWADPSFSTSDIANLNNANKYGLLVGNCCQSNKFEESACFGEVMLRTPNEGAVGYIGASDYSYWDEDYYWGVGNTSNIIENPTYAGTGLGSYDRTFHDQGAATSEWFIANGQMIVAGNLAVQASSSSLKKYYWEEYHLMGDPSVMNYFSKPDPLTISYTNPLLEGATSLVVTTEQYTYVAISLNGILLDAKYSGTNTSVTLNFAALPGLDTALVVATKQNKIPHIAEVPIDAPMIALDAQMLEVIKPLATYSCTGVQETPRVIIRNRGTNNLTALNVKYKFNGGTIQSTPWAGNLASWQTDTIDLPAITIANGTNTFVVYTDNPNSSSDLNTTNDTLTFTFNAATQTIASDFTLTDTSFCSGPVTITPTNNSTGGSSYLWDFGDGNTSSIFEPSYIYNTNGFYTLSLIADGGICGSDISTVQIQIGAEPPVVSDTSSCGAASFLLTATGSNLSWYDAAVSGNLVTTGNTYTTPLLSSPTTYYVCSSITNSYTGGKPDNTGTGGYFTSTTVHGIIFNCYSPVTLKTVKMYAGAAGNRTITLQNSAGTTLDQLTVNLATGENTITLDFDIPVGTNLKLLGPASPNLYRNGSQTGPNLYPFMVGDAIEMVQSTASGYETQFYYYFYNWEIEQTCQSAMMPIEVNVYDVPATSFTFSANYLNVNFTNASTGSGSYLWDFGDGNTSTQTNPSHIYGAAGTYWVVLTQTNSCGTDVDSLEVTVDVNTGIENNNVVARVFPNPANNNVTISSATEMLRVDLFDATGKLMYSEASNSKSTTVNVAQYASGLYYIRITTADGVTNKPLTIE